MDTEDFITQMSAGYPALPGTDLAAKMIELSEEAIQLCMELNTKYTTMEERVELMSRLTGAKVPDSFRLFPPFTTDCGKNTHIGERVFINSGCRFQDQGGITIGDDALIGHNVVLATLNHGLNPEPAERNGPYPQPIVLESRVGGGANVTILPGVTIGHGSVVAAGAVVTQDVAPNTLVGGIPARKLSDLP